MSEQPTSGDVPAQPTAAAAPAETSSATPASVPTATFGTGRGSGLARGKRSTTVAPSAANTAPRGDYKPTAVQVVVAEREYQNPFASETPPVVEVTAPVSTTVSITPTEGTAPEASVAKVETAPSGPVITASPLAEPRAIPESVAPVVQSNDANSVEPSAEKASLTILPPAETRRPSTSWDSNTPRASSGGRREDRPVFRAERPADGRPSEPRGSSSPVPPRESRRDGREGREGPQSREGRENRDGRFPREDRDGRPPRENRGPANDRGPAKTFTPVRPTPPTPAAEHKSGGFVGWLKGLFGGGAAETPSAPSAAPTGNRDSQRSDDRGGSRDGSRRRHGGGGGGRGRGGFESRGPRDGQGGTSDGSARPEGERGGRPFGEDRGGGDGGGRRRRHRGGRGRNRGDFGGGGDGQRGGGDTPPSNS